MKLFTALAGAGVLAAAAFVVFVPTWNRPPTSTEVGFPQEILLHTAQERAPINRVPAPLPPAETGRPSATEAYKNVQVLTDVPPSPSGSARRRAAASATSPATMRRTRCPPRRRRAP